MQESDSCLHALWLKAKQYDSRYCISNDLPYERSRKVDDPGLLLLSEKLRDEVLYLALDRLTSGHMGISKTISRIRQHFGFKAWNKLYESMYCHVLNVRRLRGLT